MPRQRFWHVLFFYFVMKKTISSWEKKCLDSLFKGFSDHHNLSEYSWADQILNMFQFKLETYFTSFSSYFQWLKTIDPWSSFEELQTTHDRSLFIDMHDSDIRLYFLNQEAFLLGAVPSNAYSHYLKWLLIDLISKLESYVIDNLFPILFKSYQSFSKVELESLVAQIQFEEIQEILLEEIAYAQ